MKSPPKSDGGTIFNFRSAPRSLIERFVGTFFCCFGYCFGCVRAMAASAPSMSKFSDNVSSSENGHLFVVEATAPISASTRAASRLARRHSFSMSRFCRMLLSKRRVAPDWKWSAFESQCPRAVDCGAKWSLRRCSNNRARQEPTACNSDRPKSSISSAMRSRSMPVPILPGSTARIACAWSCVQE
jgi:hypothetical protein